MINRTIVSALTLVLIVGAFVGGWYFGKSQNDEPQTSDSMNTSGTVNRTPAVQTVANVQNFSLEINESARSKDSQTKIQLTDFQVLDSQYKAVVNVILADGTTSELTLTPSKQYGTIGSEYLVFSKLAGRSSGEFYFEKIWESEADYVCTKGANCMPMFTVPKQNCAAEYIRWAQDHCPDFGVVY